MNPTLVLLYILAWLWPVPLGLSLLGLATTFVVRFRGASFWCTMSSIVTALVLLVAMFVVNFSSRAPSTAANVPLWLGLFVVAPLFGSLLILVQSQRKRRRTASLQG